MSDSTTNSLLIPLPDSNDPRKLPLLIAEYCGFKLAYHDVDEERYYSVFDWVAGIAHSSDPSKFWDAMKRRLKKAGYELSTWCRKFSYTAENGRTYKMDHASENYLYQITQRMDANTGIRDQILQYLSKAGVLVDDIRIDPDKAMEIAIEGYRRMGKDDRWIGARLNGKIKRERFTSALKASVADYLTQRHYAVATDDIYLGLWKRTAAQLKGELKLSSTASLRDNQPTLALIYQGLAEEVAAQKLLDRQELGWEEAEEIVCEVANVIGVQAQATSKYLSTDIATGKPLLPEKTL